MSIAETAELAVLLKLGTSGSFKGATSELSGVEQAALGAQTRGIGGLQRGFGVASVAASRFGGALGHAKSQIGGLLSGPLGLIGLGAGLFTIGGALEHGITKAQSFGDEVYKLKAITGLSAETVSALAAGLEHFGIGSDAALRSIGFLEKNVGLLAARKDGIVNFEKAFGFSLRDANGHLKDANALILASADYFNNKSIPATEKAAALAKLYGRTWQTLLPALIAGRKGIEDAEQAAHDLGLTLTEDNIGALAKFRNATRELGTAVGGLELQIGLALVPALTDLAHVATTFVSQNRDKIVGFFKDAAHFAQDLGSVIEHQVVPVFGAIASAWSEIPKGLRDLLVTGFVANKVIKWTFGVDIAGGLISGLSKIIGKGIVQPVFVTNQIPGLGGSGGALGGIGGGGLLASIGLTVPVLAAVTLGVIAAAGLSVLVNNAINAKGGLGLDITHPNPNVPAFVPVTRDPSVKGPLGLGGKGFSLVIAPPIGTNLNGTVVTAGGFDSRVQASSVTLGGFTAGLKASNITLGGFDVRIKGAGSALTHAVHAFNPQKALDFLIAGIHKRSMATLGHAVPESWIQGTLGRDLLKVTHNILATHKTAAEKLAEIDKLQKVAVAAKDWGVAKKLGADIAALKKKAAEDAAKVALAVKNKKLAVTVNNSITVPVTVNSRAIATVTARTQRFYDSIGNL